MSVSLTIQRNLSGGSASPLRSSQEIVADGEVVFDGTIPGSTPDHHIVQGIDISQLKALFMLADGDLTIETNDGTTPDDTIALKDDLALMWDAASGYFDNPFSVDVTDLYVTNGSGTARSLKIYAVLDATP